MQVPDGPDLSSYSARYYLAKVAADTALQDMLRLTVRLFKVPMAQVNVLDHELQHTVASAGTPLGTMPRSDTLCDAVVRDGAVKTIDDFERLPPAAAGLRTYVGVPLTGREGLVIGSLCLLDTEPRRLSEEELADLQAAAAVVEDQLELLRRLADAPPRSLAHTTRLLKAIESDEVLPFYQPLIDLRTGRVRGVEALARWDDPMRGLIPPDSFIPQAEDSELIIALDLQILRRAVGDLLAWQQQVPDLQLSVNLSGRHFDHPDCADRLTKVVTAGGVDPRYVTFEITETAALASQSDGRNILTQLRAAGFQIDLDDFGTGYSAMDRVLMLPITGIKLDRSLTSVIGTPVGDVVLRALLTMANELGLDSVIEGVETGEQAAAALASGCTLGQGYLWSPAIPAGALRLDRFGLHS